MVRLPEDRAIQAVKITVLRDNNERLRGEASPRWAVQVHLGNPGYSLEEMGVSASEVEYHYLVSTTTAEPTVYTSLVDAVSALQSLVVLQEGRGYETERNPSGRYTSKHPENPPVIFWIEDETGAVVS